MIRFDHCMTRRNLHAHRMHAHDNSHVAAHDTGTVTGIFSRHQVNAEVAFEKTQLGVPTRLSYGPQLKICGRWNSCQKWHQTHTQLWQCIHM